MYIYIKFIQYILIMFQFLPDSPHIHTHQVHRLSVFQSKTKQQTNKEPDEEGGLGIARQRKLQDPSPVPDLPP